MATSVGRIHFTVEHRPGSRHQNADSLSRFPHSEENSEVVLPVMALNTPGQNADTSTTAVSYGTSGEDAGNLQTTNTRGEWLSGWSINQLKEAQVADTSINTVIHWIEMGQRPTQNGIVDRNPTVLSLWAQWNRLILEEGLLHRNWESQDGKRSTLQLVIPQTLTHDVLRALHNAPSAGHFGYRKTLLRVRQRFYWPGMNREIEEWCRRCERCASRKTNGQKPLAPLQVSQPSYPMERIALDILGPLPMTARSNRYVLLIGDYYTKWVEAVAIPNQEAKTVALVLLDEFICRFGAPAFIHTDQGRNFESSLFRELCSLLNIQKTRTTAYHPESDGFVERFSRTLENMLSMYVEDNQTDWDLHLQSVMLAYRSTVQDTTGYTAHFLMTGREINLPIDVMFRGTQQPSTPCAPPEYIAQVRQALQSAYERVRNNTQSCQRRQKDYYDRRVHGSQYSVGDRVWLHVPYVKRGRTPKLCRPWQGPYTVIKKLSDVTYRIQQSGNGRRRRQVVHFNRIKPYSEPSERDSQDDWTLTERRETR